jgi:hypothetical protein
MQLGSVGDEVTVNASKRKKFTQQISVPLGRRLTNIVDAGNPRATKRDRPRTYGLSRSIPPGHVVQATTQRFIDQALQPASMAAPQSFERRGDIVIKS